MAKIIDGKLISQQIKDELKARVEELVKKGKSVTLAVIMAGDNPASAIYVKNKIATCEYLGIKSLSYHFGKNETEEQLAKLIKTLNDADNIDGILVQLPLPKHIDEARVLSLIKPEKDVDGFHSVNAGNLFLGRPCVPACTPAGIIRLIKSTGISISGKHAVVIGRSNIVGKPVSILLQNENATVTMCHSRTANLAEHTKNADILVVAIGKDRFVNGSMVKKGAVVIDVGMNRTDGKLYGDVDFESCEKVAGYITPVPGGVGPMTIVMLMENTVNAAANKLAMCD